MEGRDRAASGGGDLVTWRAAIPEWAKVLELGSGGHDAFRRLIDLSEGTGFAQPCDNGESAGTGRRTEFFKPEKGRYLHPTEPRAITHYEATLLQGFPPDYRWAGSKAAIARQIGNAVPIQLSRALGDLIASSPFV